MFFLFWVIVGYPHYICRSWFLSIWHQLNWYSVNTILRYLSWYVSILFITDAAAKLPKVFVPSWLYWFTSSLLLDISILPCQSSKNVFFSFTSSKRPVLRDKFFILLISLGQGLTSHIVVNCSLLLCSNPNNISMFEWYSLQMQQLVQSGSP